MAIETRTLVFDQSELAAAVHAYFLRRNLEVPEGRIDRVEGMPENHATILVRFSGGASAQPRVTTLDTNQVAAALILYCRDRGVPLPRQSSKRITPAGDGLALVIRVDDRSVSSAA